MKNPHFTNNPIAQNVGALRQYVYGNAIVKLGMRNDPNDTQDEPYQVRQHVQQGSATLEIVTHFSDSVARQAMYDGYSQQQANQLVQRFQDLLQP